MQECSPNPTYPDGDAYDPTYARPDVGEGGDMKDNLLRKALHTAEDIRAVLAGKDLSDQYKIGYCEAKMSDLVVLLRLVLGDHKETEKEEISPNKVRFL